MTVPVPRNCRRDLMTPPEVALREALRAVEAMPADVRLTHASNCISDAAALRVVLRGRADARRRHRAGRHAPTEHVRALMRRRGP